MNLIFDVRLDSILCTKCNGLAEINKDGNVECEWEECKHIHFMFSNSPEENIFQLEFDF